MKLYFLFLPLLLVNACKTTNTNTVSDGTTNTDQMEISTSCPENGECSATIQKGKTLVVKEDGTGALYPEITSGDNIVVVYSFSQKGPEGTADGDYSETIHFEIPASTTKFTKSDASLQDVQLLYGKQCYCKGEAGFYKVKSGTLQVTKKENEVQFMLRFKVDETSHKLTTINKTIQL